MLSVEWIMGTPVVTTHDVTLGVVTDVIADAEAQDVVAVEVIRPKPHAGRQRLPLDWLVGLERHRLVMDPDRARAGGILQPAWPLRWGETPVVDRRGARLGVAIGGSFDERTGAMVRVHVRAEQGLVTLQASHLLCIRGQLRFLEGVDA